MPFIIVATDFSVVADNALTYACDFALAQNVDVSLIHTYAIPVTLGDLSIPMPAEDFREDADIRMSKLITELHQLYPQITFKSAIIYGNIIDAITEFTGEGEPPLLVIAGNSYSHDNPAWLDSTLIDAFRMLRYPILAVPPEAHFEQIRKVGFVYDNELGGSEHALQQLAALCVAMGVELHVHNNQTPPDKGDLPIEINNGARGLLNSANPLYHYTYEDNTDATILDFVARYHLDWLVVMPRRHSFLESLFHKSHTKALVNNGFIPILALHETEV